MPEPISDAARILGERIRQVRLRLAISQDDVANLAEMNVSNYGKIERGLSNPRFHTLVRIAQVLGVDPGVLVKGIPGDSLPGTSHSFTAKDFVRERQTRR
jgi:transcriptional regulator with XRE-family HTH domain